jgi:hypothetical protein
MLAHAAANANAKALRERQRSFERSERKPPAMYCLAEIAMTTIASKFELVENETTQVAVKVLKVP